jgi:hypothetical protein
VVLGSKVISFLKIELKPCGLYLFLKSLFVISLKTFKRGHFEEFTWLPLDILKPSTTSLSLHEHGTSKRVKYMVVVAF